MPTAARLVASILMAISGFIVVTVVVNVYPDVARRSVGLTVSAVVMGVLVGWLGLGKRIGEDEGSGIASGVKAGIAMFLWVLFLYALEAMIAGIMDHAYYQPMGALLVIPSKMLEYGRMALNVPIMGTMLVLAGIVGKMTKNADRRWS